MLGKYAKVVTSLFSLLFLSGCSSVYRDAGIRNNSSLPPAILIHEKPIGSRVVIEKIDSKWFQAKAGEVYRVEAKIDEKAMRWSAWIVEDSTGNEFRAERAKPEFKRVEVMC